MDGCLKLQINLIATLLLLSWTVSCRVRDTEILKVKEMSTKRSRQGSYFDNLFGRYNKGEWFYNIPDDYETLIHNIEEKTGYKSTSVLIPLGRSAQRLVSNPDFFEHPRIVSGFTSYPTNPKRILGLDLRDKIFIGYAEKAFQVEIISWDPELNRFRFQEIKNFAMNLGGSKSPATKPLVVNDNEGFCMSCHKSGLPLFPANPWSETNSAASGQRLPLLGEELIERIGDQRPRDIPNILTFVHSPKITYHGVNLKQSPRSLGTPGQESEDLDGSIERIRLSRRISVYWEKLCGSGSPESVECRSLILFYSLRARLEFEEFPGNVQSYMPNTRDRIWIVSVWDKNWTKEKDFFEPLTEIPDLAPDLSNPIRERIEVVDSMSVSPKDIQLKSFVRNDFDEVADVVKVHAQNLFSPVDRTILLDALGIGSLEAQLSKLREAVERIAQRAIAGESDLLSEKFRHDDLMLAILDQLAVKELPQTFIPYGKSANETLEVRKPFWEKSDLSSIFKYCGSCHRAGTYDFLSGESVSDVKQNLRNWVEQIKLVVSGEIEMPPQTVVPGLYQTFRSDEASRKQILDLLNELQR